MRNTTRIPILLAAMVGLGAAACSTARRSEPFTQAPLNLSSPGLARGQLVFMANCQRCHPNGEAGAGLPLNNVHLPGLALRFRIRDRAFLAGLGRMPSFKKSEISRTEMNDLLAYMKAKRHLDPDPALTRGPVRDPQHH